MAKKNNSSIKFSQKIYIKATASIVGPTEKKGTFKEYYDVALEDMYFGENTWEKAESKFVKETFKLCMKKAKMTEENVDYLITGDLLNQNIGSTFGLRDYNIPIFGVFGACSTMGEAMGLGSILIDGGYASNVLVGASSHFCSAERQFRYPLELGNQRPKTASWTVTGDGSAMLTKNGHKDLPYISCITTGQIIDLGICDPFNMGAAMAPAAVDTLKKHFINLDITPDYYDLIVTGDLGIYGKEIVIDLMKKEGFDLSKNYNDCGIMIYKDNQENINAGGSGCACSAVTFAGFLYEKLKKREIKKLLFIPTGALLSKVSTQQGESIPSIAHAVGIEID